MMKKYLKNWWIILLIILIAILLALFLAKRSGDSNQNNSSNPTSSSGEKLVNCTNTANVAPQKLSGWNTAVVATERTEYSPSYGATDNSTRTFSIKELNDKTSQNSVYYLVESADGSQVGGIKSIMEICDKDNKSVNYYTTATTTTTPASENATGLYQYLHSSRTLPKADSDYRIDGYLYTNGAWHLTDRISGITFTD